MKNASLGAAIAITGSMLAIGITGTAVAASANEEGRSLVAACVMCHSAKGSGIEPLAGYPKEKMFLAMQDFRSGAKKATVMHAIAKGYNDTQLVIIVSHFAEQKP